MNQLEALIGNFPSGSIAVASSGLPGGEQFGSNADAPFPPASTFKVAVMAEVLHQAEGGLLALDERIPVINSFTSAADGKPYSVDREDDADPALYAKIGDAERLGELVRRMIVRSSNLATNILIERIGVGRIDALLTESGIEGISVVRGVFDRRAHALGMDNRTSARGLAALMMQLAEGRLVSAAASREMVGILLGQEFNEGIPAGLPKAVRVAHKTGWDDGLYHDAGIIFAENRRPYALAVLTRGLADQDQAHACVAEISRLVFERVG
jgi:beta-lactamase class A